MLWLVEICVKATEYAISLIQLHSHVKDAMNGVYGNILFRINHQEFYKGPVSFNQVSVLQVYTFAYGDVRVLCFLFYPEVTKDLLLVHKAREAISPGRSKVRIVGKNNIL